MNQVLLWIDRGDLGKLRNGKTFNGFATVEVSLFPDKRRLIQVAVDIATHRFEMSDAAILVRGPKQGDLCETDCDCHQCRALENPVLNARAETIPVDARLHASALKSLPDKQDQGKG